MQLDGSCVSWRLMIATSKISGAAKRRHLVSSRSSMRVQPHVKLPVQEHTIPAHRTLHNGRRWQNPVSQPFQLLAFWRSDPRRYPKHVWSPAGGWYAQPANWKANTAVMFAVLGGITASAWTLSANREYRDKMPQPHRFFPSR